MFGLVVGVWVGCGYLGWLWVFGLVVGVWVGCGCFGSRDCNVMSSAAVVQGIAVTTVIKRMSRHRTGGLSLLYYLNV